MTIKELIEQLQRFPNDAIVALPRGVEINCVRPGKTIRNSVVIEHRASCPKEK